VTKRTKSGFGSYPLRCLVLGLLMKRPSHGYLLDQTLDEVFHMVWKAGQTKLYLTLSDLENEGLLRIVTEPQDNRPDRKVYHLTDEGRAVFETWVAEPVTSMRAARVELLAKLRFYNWLDLPGAAAFISDQVSVFRSMTAEWQADQGAEQDPFLRQVYEFRIRQARFLVDWLEDFPASIFED